MKMKHILMVGAIALVVVGCVLAAGCTSTTTNNGANPVSGLILGEPNSQDGVREMVNLKVAYEQDGLRTFKNPSPASGMMGRIDESGEIHVEDPRYGLRAFESLISKGVHYLNNSNTPNAIKGQIRDSFMVWGIKLDGSNAESCYNYYSNKRGIGSISEFHSEMDKLQDVLDRAREFEVKYS